ncbi:hypothetical protein QCD60_04045 [Pokkaliibacter sp. MBI-7]|uniref:hypothetical protein n=1 Tax=Pokkaliibacter sp. MBI-7 TaxID=3040600 RepID=UPI0024497B46|nr:hypothetical protein [Pokkaliibacter sp. MBI-7]MDH2431726.1 hypothetical protein [Pokkaliibacter sp. MBI-7]
MFTHLRRGRQDHQSVHFTPAACEKWRLGLAVLPLALILTGCAGRNMPPQSYIGRYHIEEPKADAYRVCSVVNCDENSRLKLSADERQQLHAVFEPAAVDAVQERKQVAAAVALLERINGAKNNTAGDEARNHGTFASSPQLDCIAETINTTVALLLMQREGLLHFHHTGYPGHRGPLQLLGPHNTAVMVENDNGQEYAVDSWFFANGVEPVVVPLAEWRAGYDPDKDPNRLNAAAAAVEPGPQPVAEPENMPAR